MTSLVVDTSVVAKAFFPEQHSEAAKAVLAGRSQIVAPDLIVAEFASVVWKRCRKKQITSDEATELMTDFLSLPLRVVPASELITDALDLAIATDRTVYDSLFLALAIRPRTTLVTGDEKLCNALRGGALAKHIRWIGQ